MSDSDPAVPGPAQPQRAPLRARFLADLPDDPELRRLGEAFERGNYALVRTEGRRLAESAPDEAVRNAAEDLVERLEPDPLMKYLLALSVLLLLVVTAFVYASQGHG